jgi:hypothetical protein
LGNRVWFFLDLRTLLPGLAKKIEKKTLDGKEVEIVRGVAVAVALLPRTAGSNTRARTAATVPYDFRSARRNRPHLRSST